MTEDDESDVVSPPLGWRVALNAFDQEDFGYGSKISKDWLWQAFGIKPVHRQTMVGDADKRNLQFVRSFVEFRRALLEERLMALRTIVGFGYEVVTPEEQTEFGQAELDRKMNKALAQAQSVLFNIDHTRLSDGQSRDNAEALARVGGLRALVSRKRGLTYERLRQLGRSKQHGDPRIRDSRPGADPDASRHPRGPDESGSEGAEGDQRQAQEVRPGLSRHGEN